MKRPFIWAHRGASALAPENTMAAFSAALDCGVDGIELDVHLTRDGVPVVIHDETLERTTNGSGRVNMMNWNVIRQFDAGSWFPGDYQGETIPALEQVLEEFAGRLALNIELKDFAAGLKVLDLLKHFDDSGFLLSSFNASLLTRLRQESSDLPLAFLYEEGAWHKAVKLAVDLKVRAFHPRVDLLTRPMVRCCHSAGLKVSPWTVDVPGQARSLLRAGVDGLFTNDPLKIHSDRFISLPVPLVL